MFKSSSLTAVAVAVALIGVPATAATIVNGGFELGVNPGAGFTTEAAGSSAITGWTVGGFGVDYIGGYWMPSEGARSVDLSALSAGSVSQTFETKIGIVYTVNFDLSGNPEGGVGNKISVISISGSLPQVSSYTVGASNSRTNMNWQPYSFSFTAFGTSSTLTFASAEFNPYGPALDNVSILGDDGIGGAVPEPASWALMITGFGLVGAAMRRRETALA